MRGHHRPSFEMANAAGRNAAVIEPSQHQKVFAIGLNPDAHDFKKP
jgi:hypothetical protein